MSDCSLKEFCVNNNDCDCIYKKITDSRCIDKLKRAKWLIRVSKELIKKAWRP